MFKKTSNFTLIELIVVIAVLGILAAIIVPNISSFTDEARDVQLTADVRNVQTAVDMYRVKATDSTATEPLLDIDATKTGVQVGLIKATAPGAGVTLMPYGGAGLDKDSEVAKLLDINSLIPSHLRKAPKYVANNSLVADDFTAGVVDADGFLKMNEKDGKVLLGITIQEDPDNAANTVSTAIVRAFSASGVAGAETIKVVR